MHNTLVKSYLKSEVIFFTAIAFAAVLTLLGAVPLVLLPPAIR